MKKIFFLILLIITAGCNTSPSGFEKLNIADSELGYGIVQIESVDPDTNPVDLSEDNVTFVLSLKEGSGILVNFKFFFDGIMVQDGPSPFFVLNTTNLTPRGHTLKAVAYNPISEDEYIFNLYKNTPPVLTLTNTSTTSISCAGGSFVMQLVAEDFDDDPITFSFLVNGVENTPGSMGAVADVMATHTYSPPGCAVQGVQQVTIRATDARGGYTDQTIAVTVINPNVATINSFSPAGDPVTVKSTETVSFVVGATGAPPLDFVWSIDPGSVITRCADSPSCDMSGGDFSPGEYVLSVSLTDSVPTVDDHDFNIVINSRPTVTSASPQPSNVTRMNCGIPKNFTVNFTDTNYTNRGQSLSATWKLDDGPSNKLTISNNLSSPPFSAQASFAPNCDSLLMGEHTLSVAISDGHETVTTTWYLQINYFPNVCNDILNDPSPTSRGKTCTLAGLTGNYNNFDPLSEPFKTKINPRFIELYDPAIVDAYFFSSGQIVWFYNGTASPITVIGKTVGAGKLLALIGNGGHGVGTIGQSYNNFFLYNPQDLHYDKLNDKLYIADYTNGRILVVGSNGQPAIFAGGGTSHVDGDLNTTHRCLSPTNIIRDGDDLIVNCYTNRTAGDGMIKKFSLTTLRATTILRFISNADVVEGTLGIGGTGGVLANFGLAKVPGQKLLFGADYGNNCQIYGINYGDTPITLPGLGNLEIPSNTIRRLTTTGYKCGLTVGAYNNTAIRFYPYGMDVRVNKDTGELEGIYWAEINYHYIAFFNLSASQINISGRTIDPGFFHVIAGNGTAAHSRGAPAYTGTSFWSPNSILTTNHGLYIPDTNNGRVTIWDDRSTSVSTVPIDKIGFNSQAGYDGIIDKTTTLHHLSSPTVLTYDNSNNRLLFYDSGNLRVRSIDLLTGKMDVVIGNGNSGQITADPIGALSNFFRVRNVRDFSFIPNEDALLFVDGYTGYSYDGPIIPPNTGNLENCALRLWNYGTGPLIFANNSIVSNDVKNIVGSRTYGCGRWIPEYNGRAPSEVALNYPVGSVLGPDGSIYISNYSSACIVKLDPISNTISEYIGLCNTSADVIGNFTSTRFAAIGDLELDTDTTLKSAGNFFIIDGWYTNPSRIKYVNFHETDVTLFNTDPIPQGQVGRIAITDGWTTSITSFENHICFNQGAGIPVSTAGQNVICLDRESGTETLRVGKASAVTVKGGTQYNEADEGISSSSVFLYNPYGVTFDSEGNLYVTDTSNHTIRMVKRWW